MLTVTPALSTAMDKISTDAQPELVVEFNHSLLSSAEVTSPDSRDEELFPKDSVLNQRYVNSGLPKAVVGQARTSSLGAPVQYRTVSANDEYQYWVSPKLSTSTSIADAWMQVEHAWARPTNKIVVVFEVSYASPTAVRVEIHNGTSWSTIAENAVPNDEGVIALYTQSGGVWTTTENIGATQNVRGVRVTVKSMSAPGVCAHFISISARLREDMSERVTTLNIDKSLEDVSPLAPIGDSSTNRMGVTFENSDGSFDPENEESPYYGLLSRNVRMDAAVKLDDLPSVKQGQFYTESWSYSAPGVDISASTTDVSRFMQEVFLPPFVLRNYTVTQVVQDLLNRVGFRVDEFRVNSDPVVPYVWYNDEVSAWQALKDFANATLAYFYTDEFGRFIWVDFDTVTDNDLVETLDASHNLVDLNHSFDVVSNHVTVNYNIYGNAEDPVSKEPITQELWTPGEDIALLSHPLRTFLTENDEYIDLAIDDDQFRMWPDSGIVNVEGEYIRYGAKEEDSGRFLLTELTRGSLGTDAAAHRTDNLGMHTVMGDRKGRVTTHNGELRITGALGSAYDTINYAEFGDTSDSHTVYGATLIFPEQRDHETAGLVIHRDTGWSGIYIELSTTPFAARKNQNEVRVYRHDHNRNATHFTSPGGEPYLVAIANRYDVEISAEYSQTIPVYSVYINGSLVVSFPSGGPEAGRFGCFVRGSSRCDFERIYVSDGRPEQIGGRQFQSVSAGYQHQSTAPGVPTLSSGYIYKSREPTLSINEFSPRVRQVREFNIDYSIYPATAASILSTNKWQANIFGLTPGPFGAKFYAENISDRTAVLNGPASNLFEDEITMYLLAYGDPVIVQSEEKEVIRDKHSIRKNGVIELEVSNPWIQTPDMAKRAAKVILDNYSEPMDVVAVNTFPNYALQVGDVVNIAYEERGYKPETHFYYVVGSTISWGDGFTQSLNLKRSTRIASFAAQ